VTRPAIAAFIITASLRLAAQPPPRTADGKPNLEGIWNNSTLTPLERPPELAGKPRLTPEEAAGYLKGIIERNDTDHGRASSTEADVAQGYNNFWWDRGTGLADRRTALITDPPDGRVPPLTAGAQKRQAAARARALEHPADGPEDRSLTERCLSRGLPIVPGPYNNNIQIVQTPEYVAIFVETMHDVRVISIDPPNALRPHAPAGIRQALGDSRGHWDGDTLVVDTTNFSAQANFRGSAGGLHLIERFALKDAKTLNYGFTVDDPATFTKPWSALIPMARSEGPVFEYACHEGNYAMTGILSGARAEEASVKTGK
jgi:hypothetical protein